MSQKEPLQTSSLAVYPLSSSSSRQALNVFVQLLSACAGPHGKNHIVRNACGGHVTITSACFRLLSTISISRRCQPITSILHTEGQAKNLGKLTSVTPSVEKNRSYICLENRNANVVTLIVCSEWEERLSELKHCVNTCLQGLESFVKEPWLLMGGGCWQMHCSHILKEKVLSTLPEMSKKLSCPESILRQLLTAFRSCLHQWVLNLKQDLEHLSFDTSSTHCWRVSKEIPVSISNEEMKPCSCGFKSMPVENLEDLDIVLTRENISTQEGEVSPNSNVKDVEEYDNVILDNLTACMEALHKGVLTTGLLLSVGQFICDRN